MSSCSPSRLLWKLEKKVRPRKRVGCTTLVIGHPLDIQSQQGQINNWTRELDQEVYIKNATVVVWSRGTRILKTFDFSQEDQKVHQALFAWFPIPSKQLETKQFNQVNVNDPVRNKQFVEEYWQNRGPRTLLKEEEKQTTPMSTVRRRGLCITFLDHIQIHFEDGINFTAYIPFEIDHVVPLDVGLLISKRQDTKRSKQKTHHRLLIPSDKSSTCWDISSSFASITHPLLEASPVKIRRMRSPYTNNTPSSLSTDPHRLLFATTHMSDKKRLPVIVTLNVQDNKHFIWTYEHRKHQTDPIKGVRKTRPKEEFLSRKRKRSFPHTTHENLDDKPSVLSQLEREVYHTLLNPSELSLTNVWQEQKRFNKRQKTKSTKATIDVQSIAFLIHNLSGQELICLMNKTTCQLQLINLEKAAQMETGAIELKTVAKSAIAVHATRDSHLDLLFLDQTGNLWLWIDGRMPLISIPTPSSQPIRELSQSVYDRFNLTFEKETIRYRIHLQPQTSLVRDCLAALDCANSAFYVSLWHRFIQLRYQHLDWTEWHTLFVSLFSFLSLKRVHPRPHGELSVGEGRLGIPDAWMDQAMAIEKEYILSAIELNSIIKSLHVIYEDYRIKNTMKDHLEQLGYLLAQLCVILNHQNWLHYYRQEGILIGLTHSSNRQIQEALMDPPDMEVCLQQMVSRTGAIPVLLSFFGVDTLKPTFTHCRNTYAKTVQDLWSIYHAIYYNTDDPSLLVNRLTQSYISRMHIESLKSSIGAPILEALQQLQKSPQLTWSKDIYDIIERHDIYRQLQLDTTVCDPNTNLFKLPLSEKSNLGSMDQLMREVLEVPTQRCIYESDVLNMETERLRFDFGGIIENVRIMLDASHIPDHTMPPSTSEDDDDIAIEHQSQVVFLIQRTLALATGRAIYAYATHVPDLTKTLPIEPIQLAAKILPLRTIEFLQWPQFHNGIAAGLRISPSHQIDESWISFCHSGDLEPHHGGMLLAMGLNGILRRLALESWYHMIQQNCSLVPVGFILGISAAYRGTKDKKVTKLLSAYIPALLDDHAAPFNQSNLILASSLMGLGLTHMNTRDVKMAFAMLQELERHATSDLSGPDKDYPTCALSAGFSIGFIMLGRAMIDVWILTCATMALGLMYLKTEAHEVARLIEVPTTRPLLNYTRPDLLMAQIPLFMQQPTDDPDGQEIIRQAKYNIRVVPFSVLAFGHGHQLSTAHHTDHDTTCIDVLCTAAAMVMAGTGRLELLKRLEMAYGMIDGGYTLTTTNEAIAGLLCAFYPFYPLSTEDNRYHLQAFRHLWVLAVDSRWLMPVDVSTKKPCRVPMRLEIYEDNDATPLATRAVHRVSMEAPMVVPHYQLIKSIEIHNDRYWPLSIDMTSNSDYQQSIKKSGVLYVQLKEGKRSYEHDPDGRLLLASGLTALASTVWAGPLEKEEVVNQIVVFGDSYSDVGNKQRLSNGPLWSEHLAAGWNASHHNFAFSGAVCNNTMYDKQPLSEYYIPSIVDQVEMYYRQNYSSFDSQTVVAFWVGVNDVYKILETHEDPDRVKQEYKKVVDCIGTNLRYVRQLFSHTKFIVFNLPPMEYMPLYAHTEFAENRKEAVDQLNEWLRKDIEKMNKHLQAIELDLVDVHKLIQDVVGKPELFGITNAEDAYWDHCQGQCADPIDSYVWWDKTHLTGGVHRLIANSILMSGSLAKETYLDDQLDVQALLDQPHSVYRSPLFKAHQNTGLMDRLIAQMNLEKQNSSGEGSDLTEEEEEQHVQSSKAVYMVIAGVAIVGMAGWVIQQKKKKGQLVALSVFFIKTIIKIVDDLCLCVI
ncbi:GDSL-like Lipase/Acylhydrolase-domain-containing protein [Blakeslea trispora]|nr:GDSL-like Lipase/Acylhydrolase-domain-containing protein [Blakeslea trispora]